MISKIFAAFGIFGLILFLCLVVGVFLIRRWFRGVLAGTQPIELVEDSDPKWVKSQDVQTLVQKFAQLDYRPIAAYKPVSGGIQTYFFSNARRDRHGAIYKIGKKLSLEFSADTECGKNFTITNNEMLEASVSEAKLMEVHAGAEITTLDQRLGALVNGEPLRVVEEGKFTEYLQKACDEDRRRGSDLMQLPLWEDGIAHTIARWKKQGVDEERIRRNYSESVVFSLHRLDDHIETKLSEAEDLSAKALSDYRHSCFAYNERFDRKAYIDYLEGHLDLKKETRRELQSYLDTPGSCRALLSHVFLKHPELEIVRIYRINEPFLVDIYGFKDLDPEG